MKGMIAENEVFKKETRLVFAFLEAEAPISTAKL